MLSATPNAAPTFARALAGDCAPAFKTDAGNNQRASHHISDTLKLLSDKLAPQHRVVHAGDVIYQAGERFGNLYILNSGFFKVVNLCADGREQVVGLKFRGDWLGFDGIANSQYA